ncbi:MAG: FAD-dependent oxidoreductase [Acidimicrobiia bacterium]|nr:FAD-dependent oxidoreductase [Acidimicrobiia bacterium]
MTRTWRTSAARALDGRDEWSRHRLPVHDARRIPDAALLEYDVCIVGSGAAGCTAALSLLGRGLRIVVIESGGEVRDDATSAFNSVECSADRIGDESRARWLGGTTNLWTGGITTLDDIDLRERPWVPGSGWPIDAERLRSCYARAAGMFALPDPSYFDKPSDRGDGVGGRSAEVGDGIRFESDVLRTLVFQKDRRPLRFGDELRSRVSAADGVHLITLANVTSVELDASGTRVGGVEASTLLGNSFTVRSRVVMLGCGAIENARLLLASRSSRADGLGNEHDLVGRYFQDHPKGFTAALSLGEAGRRLPARRYWPARATSKGNTRWGIGLTAAAQEQLHTLNSYVRLEPVVVADIPPGVRSLRAAARGRVRKVDAAALRRILSERDALDQMARFRLRNQGPIDSILVRTIMEQEPVHGNRVRLSDRADPLGNPLTTIDSTLSDLDLHSVRAVNGALDDDLRRRGIGSLDGELDDESIRAAVGDASHHAGTTRMGNDPKTSVVDPNGQAHSVPGLYVIGASLFPTSGYANPMFTILATTMHVTDHVVGQLEARSVVVEQPDISAPTDVGLVEAKRWLGQRRRTRRARPDASRAAAVMWPSRRRAELVPVEVPAPQAGQVTVLVEASAVSAGTERARWLGLPGAAISYPHHPGYSLAGSVHAVGPGVYDLEPGDRVAVWGAPHQSLVTVKRSQVLAIREGTDPDSAAMVTLGAIAALGVARAGECAGRSIAVIGAGAIGLLAHRLAMTAGAGPSTVIAASNAKDVHVRVSENAVPRGPDQIDDVAADIVIEASGTTDGLEYALRAANVGAAVVLLGTTRAESAPLALDLVARRRLRLVGAHAGLLDAGTDGLDRHSAAQYFLDMIETGRMRVDDLVTSRIDPLDIGSMYENLAVDRRAVVPVVQWWRLAPELRQHDGPLKVPNLVRHGLASRPRAASHQESWGEPIIEHASPSPRASEYTTAATDNAARLADRLSGVGARETIVIAEPIAPVELDVQNLIHKRGTTLVGAPVDADPTSVEGPGAAA